MDKYNFFKTDGLRPSREQRLDTKLFYQNANEICSRFDEWKDEDKFYFIPLYMEMTYSMGWVAEIAPDPVWLGSFVRNMLKNPDLYLFRCPKCKKTIFPYRYCGSPLSGRVDLEGHCICGWEGFESVSGWRLRAIPLRDQLAKDTIRYHKFKLLRPTTVSYSVAELLSFLQ